MVLETVQEVLHAVDRNKGKRVFLYFMASPDETGQSWCPDCRKAEPIVASSLEHLPLNSSFYTVHTGSKPDWKNPSNEFRLSPKLQITNVPTLLEYGRPDRLVEDQLYDLQTIVNYYSTSGN